MLVHKWSVGDLFILGKPDCWLLTVFAAKTSWAISVSLCYGTENHNSTSESQVLCSSIKATENPRRLMALTISSAWVAPRALNDEVYCRFSSFRWREQPSTSDREGAGIIGVATIREFSNLAACLISSADTSSVAGLSQIADSLAFHIFWTEY